MTASLQGSIALNTSSIKVAVDRINELHSKLKEITAATRAFEKAEKSYQATTDKKIQSLQAQVQAEKQKTQAVRDSVKATKDMTDIISVSNAKIAVAEKRIESLKDKIGNNKSIDNQSKLLSETNNLFERYSAEVKAAEGNTTKLRDAQTNLNRGIAAITKETKSFNQVHGLTEKQLLAVERRIGALDVSYERARVAIKGTTLSQAEQEKQLKDLEMRYEATSAALRQYGTQSMQGVNAINAFNKGLVKQSQTLRDNLRGVGRGAGQAGIQVQQFVGQIQGGVDPMIALSQQSADLGWALGMPLAGAIAGIAFSMGTFLAPAMFDGKDATEELADSIQKLNETAKVSDDGIVELTTRIQQLAKMSNEAALGGLVVGMQQAEQALKKSVTSIMDAFNDMDLTYGFRGLSRFIEDGKLNKEISGFGQVAINLGREFGYVGDEARTVGTRIAELVAQVEKDPSTESFRKVAAELGKLSSASGKVSEDLAQLISRVNDTSLSVEESRKIYEDFKKALSDPEEFEKLIRNSNGATTSLQKLVEGYEDAAKTANMSAEALAVYRVALAGADKEEQERIRLLVRGAEAAKEAKKQTDDRGRSIRTLVTLQQELATMEARRNAYLTASTKTELDANLEAIKRAQSVEKLTSRIAGLEQQELKVLATTLGLNTADKSTIQLQKEVAAAYRDRAQSMTDVELASKSLFDLQQLSTTSFDTSTLDGLVAEYQKRGLEASQLFNQAIANNQNSEEATAALNAALDKQGTEYTNKLNEIMRGIQQTAQMSPLSNTEQLKMDFDNRAQILAERLGKESDLYAKYFAELEAQYASQNFHMQFANQFSAANNIIGGAMSTFQTLGKQNSKEYQHMALAQAAIQQAMAVSSVWADPSVPFWGKIGLSVMAGAQVAAQIKAIQSQSFSTGGYVSGQGTSTSDSIAANLSDGEYVVRAAAVRRLGTDYLDQINAGQMPMLAMGGSVGSASSSSSQGNFLDNLTVQVINEGNSRMEVRDTEIGYGEDGEMQLKMYIREAVREEMGSGYLDKSMNKNYGVTRQPRSR